jgi:hypothetical protein
MILLRRSPPFPVAGRLPAIAIVAAALLMGWPAAGKAQLRIVTYNTTTADPDDGVTTARPDLDIVLRAIGEETRGGIAKPVDVLLLQEQYTMATSTQSIVNVLNGIYGTPQNPAPYARGNVNGATSHPESLGGRPGIVFNTLTVQLIDEVAFGVVNGSNQPRATLRYQLRPVGYDASADFYIYNSHYKAGDTATDENRRQIEANAIRNHTSYGANALGEGAHVVFAGDLNLYSSSEPAFQTLLAPGAAQAFDPINQLGSWSSNPGFAAVHTQSPCLSNCVGTGGGMDDRFDFQLVTGELLDGEGLSYLGGSYHAFGNSGSTYNDDINDSSNRYIFNGVTSHTKPEILDALHSVTDHLPVVADYQLPAVMQAVAGCVPDTLMVGELFDVEVAVTNAASVVAANGADELDYSLTTSGDLAGSFLDQIDAALGGGNMHLVRLDTATPGMKSGIITIASSSQQVQNGLIEIPVSFEVLVATLAGDYNGNSAVDAADYVLWRKTLGQNVPAGSGADGNANGMIDDADFTVWRANFGHTSAGASRLEGAPLPEPAGVMLALLGAIGVVAIRRRELPNRPGS